MRSILSSQGIVPSIAMEKEFPVRKTMSCLFPLVWTITLKTFLMILLSGLFFMDPTVVKNHDCLKDCIRIYFYRNRSVSNKQSSKQFQQYLLFRPAMVYN